MYSGLIGTSYSKTKLLGASHDTCTMWCRFNENAVVHSSYNVGSTVDSGSGSYRINFLRPTANANFAVVLSSQCWFADKMHFVRTAAQSTTGTSFHNIHDGAYTDCTHNHIAVFGGNS